MALIIPAFSWKHLLLFGVESGAEVVDLGEALKLGRAQWSPDGRSIAIKRPGAAPDAEALIEVVTPNGEPVRALALGSLTHKQRFSPDGQRLAFAVRRADSDAEDLYLVDLPDGSPRQVTTIGMNIFDLSWSAEGSYLAFTTGPVTGEGCP